MIRILQGFRGSRGRSGVPGAIGEKGDTGLPGIFLKKIFKIRIYFQLFLLTGPQGSIGEQVKLPI